MRTHNRVIANNIYLGSFNIYFEVFQEKAVVVENMINRNLIEIVIENL